MKIKNRLFFIIYLFLFSLLSADEYTVESESLARIQSLSFEAYDSVLIDLDEAVERNDMLFMAHKKTSPKFYTYIPSGKDGVLSVSAATQVPVDTFVTLNSISSADTSITGKKVILTDVKGIFVAEKPVTELEIFLYNTYKSDFEESQVFNIDGKRFYFFEGERFSPYHRLYFLDSNFSLPLDKKIVTSAYGLRESPVYGSWKKHNGVDFAANEGDNVYSCRMGRVSFVKENDEVFGNYLIVTHSDSLTSVYAHLSKILVKEGDSVKGGQRIALSGSSGMVTGPHLHFEIRRNGKAIDPERILPKNKAKP